jgi:uncharacterized protein YecT (DUF1311 family)
VSARHIFTRRGLSMALLIAGLWGNTHAIVGVAQSMNDPSDACAKVMTTAEMSQCYDKEYKTADLDLNRLYGRIQKVLHPDELPSLVQAERLWVQYRDATCQAEHGLFGGGSGGPPARLACLAAETRARQASLLRSYSWRLDKFGG